MDLTEEEPHVTHGPDESREYGDFSTWLEHARWVWERQRVSYDELGRQAVAFLSLDGVLLALLANAKPNIHGAARDWIAVAIWPALLSAILALLAALPRPAGKLPATRLREKWREYNRGERPPNLAADLTEMLLESKHGDGQLNSKTKELKKQEGPLAELRKDARWRGAETMASGVLATVAIALVVIAIAVR
jgi:hypothetical protein